MLASNVKLSLTPLWVVFRIFTENRLELGKGALTGCEEVAQSVRKLLGTDPLSSEIFDEDLVAGIKQNTYEQYKPVSQLLSFSQISLK